jgi:hypothetical protein
MDFEQLSKQCLNIHTQLQEPDRQAHPGAAQDRRAGQRRLALTGRPVENEPGEWFSVLSGYAIPGLFGSATDFLGRY